MASPTRIPCFPFSPILNAGILLFRQRGKGRSVLSSSWSDEEVA